MARKPNYQFDRSERERKKAAKKAERQNAKQAKADEKNEVEADAAAAPGDESED